MNKRDAAALLIVGGSLCFVMGAWDVADGVRSVGAMGMLTGVWCVLQGASFWRDVRKKDRK